MIEKPPELLAPAGSPEAYRAAAAAGADAVYLGAKGFNARAQAQNFSNEELVNVIEDAHVRGMKVYLTLNTLIGENEMEEAAAVASFAYCQGVDGIIVQDLGLVHLLKSVVPGLPIHASTQMSVHNIDGVKAAQELGISRVVLSRESTLEEIKTISRSTGMDLEVFIHGALCICRSGQCLLSSFIGGRSGNRGRCAQPCRLPWKTEYAGSCGEYLISPRDLMTLELLPDLIAAGVSSLKIEGRMKSPEYVAATVMTYRKYLDLAWSDPASYKVDKQDVQMLEQVFNRGGFTTGYLKGRNFTELMSTQHPKHWGIHVGTVERQTGDTRSKFGVRDDDRLVRVRFSNGIRMGDGLEIHDATKGNPSAIVSVMMKNNAHVKAAKAGESLLIGNFKADPLPGSPVYKTYDKNLMEYLSGLISRNIPRVPVTGQFRLYAGERPALEIEDEDGSKAEARGEEIAQQADNRPISEERIAQQMKKTGDTPFYFRDIRVLTDNGSFIPVSVINELRREALGKLSDDRKNIAKRKNTTQLRFNLQHFPGNDQHVAKKREMSLYFFKVPERFSWDGLPAERAYLPVSDPDLFDTVRKYGIKGYAQIPSVLSDSRMEWYVRKIGSIKEKVDGILVGNLGMLYRMRSTFPDIPVVLDFQMNIYNSWALEALKGFKPSGATLSVELNLDSISQIRSPDIPLEAYVYGEIPVMTMEYCPGSDQGSCSGKCGSCRQSSGYLTDRLGKRFLYRTDPFLQRTTLYNSSRMMLEDVRPLMNTGVDLLRIGIMDESPDEARGIINYYHEQWVKGNTSAMLDPDLAEKLRQRGVTGGHYYRGVE